MPYWKDGLSIDETKSSALVLCLVVLFGFTLVMYFQRGDISDNLLTLNLTLASLVGGYNIIHDISSVWGKNNK